MKTKRKSSFVTQAAILAAAGLLSRFLGFLYRVPLTRWFGDPGNAISSISTQVYNLFLIISSSGLPAAISKMVSERIAIGRRDEAHRVFKIAFRLSSIAGFICMLIILVFAGTITSLMNSPNSKSSLMTLAPTVFIVSMLAVYRGYFQGMGSTVPTAISQIVEQIFNAIFSILLAYVFMDIARNNYGADSMEVYISGATGSTTGTGIGAMAGLLFIFAFYWLVKGSIRRGVDRVDPTLEKQSTKSIAREILRLAVPIIAGTAVFSITNLIDATMVQSRLYDSGATEEQVLQMYGMLTGKYVTMITLPVSISSSFATAAIPAIAASYKLRETDAVNSKINTSLRISMLISIPAALGLGVLGTPIIQMLFGAEAEGGFLLNIGFPSIIFLALTQILTGVLQSIGRVDIPVKAAICGAIVKILLNYILVGNPNIGINGAVVGTIGCYIVTSIINWRMLVKETRTRPDFNGIMVKPLVASLGMALGCYIVYTLFYTLLGRNTISVALAIVVAVVLYVVFLLAIGGLREEDIRLLPMGNKLAKALGRFIR